MTRLPLLLLAIALASQSASAHTYFSAAFAPAKPSVESSASLEFMTHGGIAYFNLNVSDVESMASAKLVFGNASLSSEPVVSYIEFDPESPMDGTYIWEGQFSADNFTMEYPWTMNGLQANIGLGNVWAVINNDAPYSNTMLLGQVMQVSYSTIQSPFVQNPPIPEE